MTGQHVLEIGIDQKMQFRNLWFLGNGMPTLPVVIMNSSHLIVDGLLKSCPNSIEMIELLNELRKYEFGDLKFRVFEDVNSNRKASSII